MRAGKRKPDTIDWLEQSGLTGFDSLIYAQYSPGARSPATRGTGSAGGTLAVSSTSMASTR